MSRYTSLTRLVVAEDARFAMTFALEIPEDIERLSPEAEILAASCQEPLEPVIETNEEYDLNSIFGVAYRFQCATGVVDTSSSRVHANTEAEARALLELVDFVRVNPDEC